ncbi:MAG TPA: hypothetical protein ENK57_26465, partial [Polyangiaceae bacterium]|nr:hypothetical protein [Polyangiaceae bacterium]
MTTPDPSTIRTAFARAFPGRDFDDAVARLDKLVDRFVRMGSFADATIAMARNVDNDGGRTTISDSDFALVAFFAGAGRFWLVSDPPEPSDIERRALAEETFTEGAGRPELVYSQELPANVELSVELGREDITAEVTLGALAPIVHCIRGVSSYLNSPPPWSMVDACEIHTMLPAAIRKDLRFVGYDSAPSQIKIAVTLGGHIRLAVDEEFAHRITVGARGRPFDEV